MRSFKRFKLASRRGLRLQRLEDRITPAEIALSGTEITVTGEASVNILLYTQLAGSPIQQIYFQPGVVPGDNLDCDSFVPGQQKILLSAITKLSFDLSGSSDGVTFFESLPIPTITFANVEEVAVLFGPTQLSGGNVYDPINYDATLTDGGISFTEVQTDYSFTFLTAPTFIRVGGRSGDNTFDAMAASKYHVHLHGEDGNDILRGGLLSDLVVGGNGDDVVEGGGGNDNKQFYPTLGTVAGIYGDAGNDILRGGDGNDDLFDVGPNGAADGGPGTDFYHATGVSSALITDTSFSLGSAASVGNAIEAIRIDGTSGNDMFDASAYTLGPVALNGGDGHDTLLGGAKTDLLYGGIGDDLIVGNGGDDQQGFSTLFGYNSGIYGEAGNDTLRGGDGRDYLVGGDGDDDIDGGAGNDSGVGYGIFGNLGNDILRGGDGDDYLEDIGPSGAADGGPGTDFYYASQVSGALITDSSFSMGGTASVGNTMEFFYLDGDENGNVMDAGGYSLSAVLFRGFGGNDTLIGGAHPDRLDGGEGDDALDGRGGSENNVNIPQVNQSTKIIGGNGNDILRGGDGDDYLEDIGGTGSAANGGNGADRYYGSGFSNATITDGSLTIGSGLASIGNELEGIWLDGTAGADTYDGSAATLTGFVFRGFGGADTLRGGSLTDGIEGGDGDDLIEGNGGDDRAGIFVPGGFGFGGGLYGQNDNDTISGGPGNDGLSGGAGNDDLSGDGGNDTLTGDNGDDVINDGPEANQLVGSDGSDSVFLTATPNADLILVAVNTVTINGAITSYQFFEALTIDAGAGIDEGTEVGGPNPLAYVVNNLEPTVDAGANEISNATPFVRTGAFKDIGAGQTWTAQADYGDGTGLQSIPVNQANHTYELNHAYAGDGNYNVTVTVTDNAGNTGSDSFTFTRSQSVTGFTVNGGAVQRSRLTQVVVNFFAPVDAATFAPSGAVTFTRTAGGPSTIVNASNGLIVMPASGMVNNITLTFANSVNAGVEYASLADGRWQLGMPGVSFTSLLNDPTLRRLFGDADGDGDVDTSDFGQFRVAFGGANNIFDFDNDGDVDTSDFGAFRSRFGASV